MSNTHQVRTDFEIGEKAQISKVIQQGDIETIAKVTGDYNPLHLDESFAKKTRFGGRIAHGILGVGLISAVLGTQLPGPGGIYLSQSIDFLAPVRVGDKITAEVEVIGWKPERKILSLDTRCFNQNQKNVLTGKSVLLVESIE